MAIGVHEGSSVIVPTLGSRPALQPARAPRRRHTPSRRCWPARSSSPSACSNAIPALRVVFLESGGGWVPFWLERLDEQAESFGGFCPEMRLAPERVLRPAVLDQLRDRRAAPCPPWPRSSARSGSCGGRTTRTTTPPSRVRSTRCGAPSPRSPPRSQAKDPRRQRGRALRAARPRHRGCLTMFGDVVREAAARYGDTPLYVTPDGSALSYAGARPAVRRRRRRPAAPGAWAPATSSPCCCPRVPPTPWSTRRPPRSARSRPG